MKSWEYDSYFRTKSDDENFMSSKATSIKNIRNLLVVASLVAVCNLNSNPLNFKPDHS